jgi:hypothetical protein
LADEIQSGSEPVSEFAEIDRRWALIVVSLKDCM